MMPYFWHPYERNVRKGPQQVLQAAKLRPVLFASSSRRCLIAVIISIPSSLALAFTVVSADESLQTFCKSDESNGKRTMLEYLTYGIIRAQLVGVYPNALSHKKEVADPLLALYVETVLELVNGKVHHVLQLFKEESYVMVGLDSKSRQVDRCKAEISSACYYLPGGIIVVAYYSCTASHVSYLGIRVAFLVILKIIRSVDK